MNRARSAALSPPAIAVWGCAIVACGRNPGATQIPTDAVATEGRAMGDAPQANDGMVDDGGGGDTHGSETAPVQDAGTPRDAPGSEVPATDAGGPSALVHYIGRFDTRDSAGPRFSWPGSAIVATFIGTGITAQMTDSGDNYFTVVIDSGTPTVVPTSGTAQTYRLASGLSSGTHTLSLTKRSESMVGVVQLLALSPVGGTLMASPEPSQRHIEFVGDSITTGFGDLTADPTCTAFSSDIEDETIAYGAITAAQLQAEHAAIAYYGLGVLRDAGGGTSNQMPQRFTRTLADDSTSKWGFSPPAPDVVVVNLGTNDLFPGDPGIAFQQAYVAFIQQIRSHYANAAIICTLSPMLTDPARSQGASYIRAAVNQLNTSGDQHVSYLEFAEQLASDGYGCDHHPSPTTHRKMAATLVPAIRALTGW